jgi:dihydrolipoamide dehydrogenase
MLVMQRRIQYTCAAGSHSQKRGLLMNHFQVAVIGSGPGGYVAAGRAAQLGMKTAIIEKDLLGGICLNWGCIPTKALLESAHAYETIKSAEQYGLIAKEPGFDFSKVIARSRQVADRMSKGVGFLMKQRNVTVIKGEARLVAPKGIHVKSEAESIELTADHIIIATGAHPVALPGLPFDGKHILNFKHAMSLLEAPKSLVVIGAGAIGMEFADFYRTFGTSITVIEMLPSILPNEDEEIIKELSRTLRRKNIQAVTGSKVEKIEISEGGASVYATTPKGLQVFQAEKVLVSVGVRPNIGSIGLDDLGIAVEKGFIKVDERMRANIPGIYAIGDAAKPPMLAHKASAEALACVNSIAGHDPFIPVNYKAIPSCTYCKPQVASIGMTEKAALESGHAILKGVFPFRANGRSIAMNETEGIVKLIFDKESQRLLGAHILHAHASDLIGELSLAISTGADCRAIADAIHAHPTLSEAIMEAAAAALGEAVHI